LAFCGARFKFKFASVNLKGLNCAALDKILNGVGKINGTDKISSVAGACGSAVNLKGIVQGRSVKTAALVAIVLIGRKFKFRRKGLRCAKFKQSMSRWF